MKVKKQKAIDKLRDTFRDLHQATFGWTREVTYGWTKGEFQNEKQWNSQIQNVIQNYCFKFRDDPG